jgi:hypothetical protein
LASNGFSFFAEGGAFLVVGRGAAFCGEFFALTIKLGDFSAATFVNKIVHDGVEVSFLEIELL